MISEPTTASEPVESDRPEWWSSDEWATPPHIVERISAEYGPFDLDACCRPETAKAPTFYTKADDGLRQPWDGVVWVNPPYSDPKPWCQKAVNETLNPNCFRVVMLLPAATDTGWFHDLVLPHADIRFIRGRIRFLGWKGTPIGMPKAGNILAVYPKLPIGLDLT